MPKFITLPGNNYFHIPKLSSCSLAEGIIKIILILFFISFNIHAQSFSIRGKVSASNQPVKFASVTFIDVSDTTKKFSTLTDTSGNYKIDIITSVKKEEPIVPKTIELAQNYPNPFSTETQIPYKLNNQSNINIKIYNILGQEVKEFKVGTQNAGIHGILWDGRNNLGQRAAPGVYLYQLQANNETFVKKMVFTGNSSETPMHLSSKYYVEQAPSITSNLKKNALTWYKLWITNTDSTEPKIATIQRLYVMILQDTTINFDAKEVSDSSLYVIERDHLSVFCDQDTSGYYSNPVVNFHETFVINTSPDTISCSIESPLPDTLKRESIQSPLFGKFAYIPVEYQDFYDVPNTNGNYLGDKPDSNSANSYIWKNIKLGPFDGMHIPYSNYYGEENMFIKNFGTNHFLDMDVISDYSIQKDTVNSGYINIEIKQTLQNTGRDTIYRIGFALFVPGELETKSNFPYAGEWTKLYNLISDTVISPLDKKCYLYNQCASGDGFGFNARGQEMHPAWFILPPDQSYQFIYKMTIQPLLDKFEIYPFYAVNMIIKDGSIWPSSMITVNNKKYNGPIHYLRECGLGGPTYIIFSINKDTLKVVSPDEIVPTFIPPYIKPQGR